MPFAEITGAATDHLWRLKDHKNSRGCGAALPHSALIQNKNMKLGSQAPKICVFYIFCYLVAPAHILAAESRTK